VNKESLGLEIQNSELYQNLMMKPREMSISGPLSDEKFGVSD
jgi:hypothetical protein